MKKFIEYFNNKRGKINNLFINDSINRNHYGLHLSAIGSLRIKIIEMMKNTVPTEEYSYFHNEIYNKLMFTINDTSLTSTQLLAVDSMKNLTSRTVMLIEDLIDGIFKITKKYFDLYFENVFIDYYFDLNKHQERVDKLTKITDKIQKYYYYPFDLDSNDKINILKLMETTKEEIYTSKENTEVKKKEEKKMVIIEKKCEMSSIEKKKIIVKEIDNLKVSGLKDKCIELNIPIIGAKVKKDYIDRLYKYYGIN